MKLKQTLTILLLLAALWGKSQVKDNISRMFIDSTFESGGAIVWVKNGNDTVYIKMLVSDSAGKVYVINGYEVVEPMHLTAIYPQPQPIYLDDKLKPLNKNIVVWQTK